MTFLEEQQAIERQLSLICFERGISREDLYTFPDWSDGEKFVIMGLLNAKVKSVQEEMKTGLSAIHKVILLSEYKMRKGIR